MRVVAWIFTTYMGIHQYRGLIQCTLDDSADKTNVYRWKIYMYHDVVVNQSAYKHDA